MKLSNLLPFAACAVLLGCVYSDEMTKQRALQEAVDHCFTERKLYIHGNVETTGLDIVETGHCAPIFSREDFEAAAAKLKGATTTDTPDHVLIESADHWQRYYLTKPGNAHYPWAIVLFVVGRGAAPGVANKEPINVVGGLSLPKSAQAPDSNRDDVAVLTWADGLFGEVRSEFKLSPASVFAIK